MMDRSHFRQCNALGIADATSRYWDARWQMEVLHQCMATNHIDTFSLVVLRPCLCQANKINNRRQSKVNYKPHSQYNITSRCVLHLVMAVILRACGNKKDENWQHPALPLNSENIWVRISWNVSYEPSDNEQAAACDTRSNLKMVGLNAAHFLM